MGGQATGRRRKRKFGRLGNLVGVSLPAPAKAGIAHRDPSLPSLGRGETLLERVLLFILSARLCRWAARGRRELPLWFGGEASRVLDVGGDRGWSEETDVESRGRGGLQARPRDGVAPA